MAVLTKLQKKWPKSFFGSSFRDFLEKFVTW